MQILISYFTRTGNTRTVASSIQEISGGELEEISETDNRDGLGGYLACGKDSILNKPVHINPVRYNPGNYDLLIVGTPVWAFTMAPAMRVYLQEYAERPGGEIAFFCTERLTGHNRTFKDMETICHQSPAATLTIKARDLNTERAPALIRQFVDTLRSELN